MSAAPPDLSRCPQRLACCEIGRGGTGFFAAPPPSAAKGKRCRRGSVASAGLNVARQLLTAARAPLGTHGHVMDERDHAPSLAAVDAIPAGAQRPASAASGLDRIVGVMSASGSYDALPSNCGHGATMGPPGCPLQSPPVPFRRRRSCGLQGLFASWGDWRGQKVFLIRKRSQVRVLDRPSWNPLQTPAFCRDRLNPAGRSTCREGASGCSRDLFLHGGRPRHRVRLLRCLSARAGAPRPDRPSLTMVDRPEVWLLRRRSSPTRRREEPAGCARDALVNGLGARRRRFGLAEIRLTPRRPRARFPRIAGARSGMYDARPGIKAGPTVCAGQETWASVIATTALVTAGSGPSPPRAARPLTRK
jgi:hypothetical protein